MKVLLGILGISLVLSIFSAQAADLWLSPEGSPFGTGRIAILGSFAGLEYHQNPGIAWGMRLPGGIQELAIGLALIAVAFLAYRALQDQPKHPLLQASGYGLILGGGIANIVDRALDGTVTDFFQIGSFPIFNVADSFVTIGVGILLLETLRLRRG